MGCGVCLAPAAFSCSCILWQRYVRLWFRNLPSLSSATRELHGPLRSERGGATLGPRWGADPLPGVAGAARSLGGVKYFVAQHVRPQGPVGVSWQARYFRRVRYRFRGRRDISKAKRSRPARRTTSARSGSDFLAERFDARRVFSRLRLRLRAVQTAVRGN